MAVESYRDLIVWQRAIQMTLAIYRITSTFPKEEAFGLIPLMRRSGIAIATRIAEGYGRTTPGDYKRFLSMARGSNLEFQTQLVIVTALGYSDPKSLGELEGLSNEVGKILNSIIDKV